MSDVTHGHDVTLRAGQLSATKQPFDQITNKWKMCPLFYRLVNVLKEKAEMPPPSSFPVQVFREEPSDWSESLRG